MAPQSIGLNRKRQVPAEDTPAFGAIAERFRRAGDLERAVALCQEGLAKFPDHLSARVTLGWALLDLGRYDEARDALEAALKRAPDNLAAIRGLAELHDRAEHTMLVPMDGPGQWPPDPSAVDGLALDPSASSAPADVPLKSDSMRHNGLSDGPIPDLIQSTSHRDRKAAEPAAEARMAAPVVTEESAGEVDLAALLGEVEQADVGEALVEDNGVDLSTDDADADLEKALQVAQAAAEQAAADAVAIRKAAAEQSAAEAAARKLAEDKAATEAAARKAAEEKASAEAAARKAAEDKAAAETAARKAAERKAAEEKAAAEAAAKKAAEERAAAEAAAKKAADKAAAEKRAAEQKAAAEAAAKKAAEERAAAEAAAKKAAEERARQEAAREAAEKAAAEEARARKAAEEKAAAEAAARKAAEEKAAAEAAARQEAEKAAADAARKAAEERAEMEAERKRAAKERAEAEAAARRAAEEKAEAAARQAAKTAADAEARIAAAEERAAAEATARAVAEEAARNARQIESRPVVHALNGTATQHPPVEVAQPGAIFNLSAPEPGTSGGTRRGSVRKALPELESLLRRVESRRVQLMTESVA